MGVRVAATFVDRSLVGPAGPTDAPGSRKPIIAGAIAWYMQIGDIVSTLLEDPVLLGIVVVLFAFVFFVYLFLRRTVTAFKQGMQGK